MKFERTVERFIPMIKSSFTKLTSRFSIGLFVLSLGVPFAQAFNDTIPTYTAGPLVYGDLSTPETTDSTLTITENAGVETDHSASAVTVYMGGAANLAIQNDGLLESAGWGLFTMNMGTGNTTVTNSGGITAADDYAFYSIGGSGTVSFNNSGFIRGSGTNPQEAYDGIVVMESNDGGAFVMNNSGVIAGQDMQADSYVVAAMTSGTANIVNTGSISSAQGFGIFVGSAVSGGTVINSGSISSATAISAQGSNTRVELQSGSQITGDITLRGSGANNTLAITGAGLSVNGAVSVGSGNTLELSLAGITEGNPFFSASGNITLTGVDLNFIFNGATLEVGRSYDLLYGTIIGWFASVDGVEIAGGYDPDAIYSSGGYDFKLLYNGTDTVSLTVVPEPAMAAGIFGLAVLAFAVGARRRR